MKSVRKTPALRLKALMLAEPRLTLGVAESLTCGNLQATIGSVSGASEYFRGGITAYTLDQKARHLHVNRAHARSVNCVSSAVAEQMAVGACGLFGADLALATTGYAEPNPAQGVEEPFAFWALAHVRKRGRPVLRSGRIELVGVSRVEAQQWVAGAVLNELVEYLEALRG